MLHVFCLTAIPLLCCSLRKKEESCFSRVVGSKHCKKKYRRTRENIGGGTSFYRLLNLVCQCVLYFQRLIVSDFKFYCIKKDSYIVFKISHIIFYFSLCKCIFLKVSPTWEPLKMPRKVMSTNASLSIFTPDKLKLKLQAIV